MWAHTFCPVSVAPNTRMTGTLGCFATFDSCESLRSGGSYRVGAAW